MDYLFILSMMAMSFISCGEAIRCWTCSSDLDPHCADTFNNTSPQFNLHHSLTDCNTQASPHYPFLKSKSVCKKVRQTVNGEPAVIRSCAWLHSPEDVGQCPAATTPSYIQVDFCETCDADSCNAAAALDAAPWTALAPAALALALALRK